MYCFGFHSSKIVIGSMQPKRSSTALPTITPTVRVQTTLTVHLFIQTKNNENKSLHCICGI